MPSSSARPYATPSKDERAAAAAVVAVVAYANDTDDDSWHWSVPYSSWCWSDDVTLDVRTAMMVIYSYYSFGVYYIYGTIICAVCQWCRRETMTRGRSWLQTLRGREKRDKLQIIMIIADVGGWKHPFFIFTISHFCSSSVQPFCSPSCLAHVYLESIYQLSRKCHA